MFNYKISKGQAMKYFCIVLKQLILYVNKINKIINGFFNH